MKAAAWHGRSSALARVWTVLPGLEVPRRVRAEVLTEVARPKPPRQAPETGEMRTMEGDEPRFG